MSTYAIIEAGSKQYRIEPQSVIDIEKIDVPEKAKKVTLDRVLLVRDGEDLKIGTPIVKGATILCEYLGNFRKKKVMTLKYRRRKASRVRRGHRQTMTRLRIEEIKY